MDYDNSKGNKFNIYINLTGLNDSNILIRIKRYKFTILYFE